MYQQKILLIGIDAYHVKDLLTGNSIALSGCVNDVDDITTFLLDRLRVPETNITTLCAPLPRTDRSPRLREQYPSAGAIRASFEHLAQDAQPNERILVYYSGHGVQLQPEGTSCTREALVPADAYDGSGVVWDYEINAWMARIAEKGADLTAIFDCCHSGSIHRGDWLGRPRTCSLPPGLSPKRSTHRSHTPNSISPQHPPSSGIVPSAKTLWDPGYIAVAASQANEFAHETLDSQNRATGAFTSKLLQELDRCTNSELSTLRWSDIWYKLSPIHTYIQGTPHKQHPRISGRCEKLVFGGPYRARETGFQVTQIDSRQFAIQAGTSAGFSEGAEVAVYGPEPAYFPPIGSDADKNARLGNLRVTHAKRLECKAVAEGRIFSLNDKAGRARVIKPGRGDALRIALKPKDGDLARILSSQSDTFQILGPEHAEQSELIVEKTSANGYRLSEPEFDKLRQNSPIGPLFETQKADLSSLERTLHHYARYNRALRLARELREPNDILEIQLLDARTAPALRPDQLQSPSLPEILTEGTGMERCATVHNGQPICIRINNKGRQPLYITLINCVGTGRVEVLGEGQQLIQPGRMQIFWLGDRLGNAFCCTLTEKRPATLDRLIAVGTIEKNTTLQWLELPLSFEQVFQRSDRSTSPAKAPPSSAWTSTVLPIKIIR